jgi:hypothetical protein
MKHSYSTRGFNHEHFLMVSPGFNFILYSRSGLIGLLWGREKLISILTGLCCCWSTLSSWWSTRSDETDRVWSEALFALTC